MRLQKKIKTNVVDVNVAKDDHLGMLSVYRTKTAARKVWGKNVEIVEVEVLEHMGKTK